MKYVLIAAACLVVQPAMGQPTPSVAEALAVRDRAQAGAFAARAEWTALTFYLQGAVEAVMAYRQALETEGAPPLFCPPSDHAESIDGLLGILNRATEADRRKSAVAWILESYAKKYPCRG